MLHHAKKQKHTAWLFSMSVFYVCVCVSRVFCAAGLSLLGIMASIWVIFPLAQNEEEDPGRFPTLIDSKDTHIYTHTHTIKYPRRSAYLWVEDNTGWKCLSGDIHGTTSSDGKSNLLNGPPQLHRLLPSSPLCSAALLIQTRPLIRPQNPSYRFREQIVVCVENMRFLLLPLPHRWRPCFKIWRSKCGKSRREIFNCIAFHFNGIGCQTVAFGAGRAPSHSRFVF